VGLMRNSKNPQADYIIMVMSRWCAESGVKL
jgi:hypothetical protein